MSGLAEVHGHDFASGRQQFGGERSLADSGRAGNPKYLFGIRIGEPGVDLLKYPVATGEALQIFIDLGIEGQRVEQAHQPCLRTFEIEMIVLDRCRKQRELSFVGRGLAAQGHAVP
jgi:hypothetical protein